MTVQVVRWAEVSGERWRNGHGMTRQIAAGSAWRLSVADVLDDGPFSSFPGIDRVITLLHGPALTLTVDGQSLPLATMRPTVFDGDARTRVTHSAPGERTQVLNLMTRREACTGRVDIVPADRRIIATHGQVVVAVIASGLASLGPGGTQLGTFDAVLAESDGFDLDGDARVAVAVIDHRRCNGVRPDRRPGLP